MYSSPLRAIPIALSLLCTLALAFAALAATADARTHKPVRAAAVQKAEHSVTTARKAARRACNKARTARSKASSARCRRAKSRLRRATTALRKVRSNPLSAPVLRVDGETLRWGRVADVDRYVLATTVPGEPTSYRVVTGLSTTPPAVAGKTVNYGLRTDVSDSAWAKEVSITYPASSTPVATEPAPTTAPSQPLPEGAFQVGVVTGSDVVNEARYLVPLGAKVVRVEFDLWELELLKSTVAAHAANGTRVLPLAGFHGSMPTVEQARALGEWARQLGPGGSFWAGRSDGHLAIREIEFGNETNMGWQYGDQYYSASYTERAKTYALRFKEAQQSIQAANPQVGLLAQGDDANTGSANWVNAMVSAVPDLGSRVAGWTVHPYGPSWQARIDRMNSQHAAAGLPTNLPVYVTEWGLSSDDGRCLSDNYGWDKCMSYAAAASTLRSVVTNMRAHLGGRLRNFFIYQGHDLRARGASTDREHYFGALTNDLRDKGAYTVAVKELLAG